MSTTRPRSRSALGASLLAGLGVLAMPSLARAEQFVLLDVTFTYTKMDADTSSPSKSHYYVRGDMLNAARPTNWTSPIDYRNGVVHVRTEVIDKPPGGENTRWTLCYIPNRGVGPGYGCTNSALYQEEGVWEFEQGMTEWWQNDGIDWTQGIRQMDLVMKDGTGGSGFAHLRPDFEKFFPTTLRITMIQVSAGSKYDPTKVPGIPNVDAGVRDGGDAGSGDASNGAGTGGAGAGSVGAGGSGAGGLGAGGVASGGPGGNGAGGATVAGSGGISTSGSTGVGSSGPGAGGSTGSGTGGATGAGTGTGAGSTGTGTGTTGSGTGAGSGTGTGGASGNNPADAGDDGGCAVSPRRTSSGRAAGVVFATLAFAVARWRRRRR